jgi:hypothetical protein
MTQRDWVPHAMQTDNTAVSCSCLRRISSDRSNKFNAICLPKYYQNNEIPDSGMGGTRSMHERDDKRMSHTIKTKRLRRIFVDDVQMDPRTIASQYVDCSCLFHDSVHWLTRMKTATNTSVPHKAGDLMLYRQSRSAKRTSKSRHQDKESGMVTTPS